MKKLPWRGKIFYSASSAGWAMLDRVVITWLMFYYTHGDSPLLLPAVFGAVLVFGRVVDAIADPLVALWSDNHRGRLGRRTPFLLFGGILYAASFILLFYPPAAVHGTSNIVYLTLIAGVYFFMFTVYVCPYLALMPELVRSTSDRVDLATLRAVFSLVGVAAALVGSGLLIRSFGMRGMVWIVALAGTVLMYMPLVVKEKEYAAAQPANLGLLAAVRTTLQNRAFRYYLAGNVTFWFGFNIITLSLPFYVIVLMGKPEEHTSALFAAAFGTAFLLFPLINMLAKKKGSKIVTVASMFIFVLILPMFYFLGQEPFGINADVFAYLIMFCAGIPLSALFVLPDAMLADITDLEKGLSGQGREAMYFGTQGLILKLLLGLSSFVTGLLMQYFGHMADDPLGIRLTGPVAAVFVLIGGILFCYYPEKQVRQAQEKYGSHSA